MGGAARPGTRDPIAGLDRDMDQWLSSLSPLAAYLVAATAIMLGATLLCGGIILLLERRKMTDSEKLAAIKKVLDRADQQLGHTRQGGTPTGS